MSSKPPIDSLTGLAYWRASIDSTADSLRAMLARGTLAANVSAGVTVALVALPLNLALAIACGLPPSVGLVSGAVAGAIGALLGASRFQITGPEVALAPITLEIVTRHGYAGLLAATLLAGIFQIALGGLRVGRLVSAIPVPVVGGFLAAVGLLVFDSQLPRLLGLPPEATPLSKTRDLGALANVDARVAIVGVAAVAVIVLLPRLTRRVPPPLVALALSVAVVALLGLQVPMIQSIETAFPRPAIPSFAGLDLAALLPEAMALTLLASIDSLLCAVSVDARTGGERTRHDQELVAQGLANITAACFGAMPVAAAVVRSMAAVEAGASTRVAPLVQSVLLGLVLVVLAPFVTFVPIVALAAILLVIGYRLIDWKHLLELRKRAPFEAAVFLATAVGIIATDFVSGVAIGVICALAHFARQQRAALRKVVAAEAGPPPTTAAPSERLVRIEGPLFFGVQDRIDALLGEVDAKEVVVDVASVSSADVSGASALSKAISKLAGRGVRVRIAGLGPQTDPVLEAFLGSFPKVSPPEPRVDLQTAAEPRARAEFDFDLQATALSKNGKAHGNAGFDGSHEPGWGYAPR